MRLDRFVSQSSSLSRSQARGAIIRGRVAVDGIVSKEVGRKVAEADRVTLDDAALLQNGPAYLMLHKPLGVVCATSDVEHSTVIDLLPDTLPKGIHPAGRLDLDTTGLVLLSDDGQWTHRVTSPRSSCEKVYHVELAEPVTEDAVNQFEAGLMLNGESSLTKPALLQIDTPTSVRVTLTEGRYHQVKRMFAAIGNRVVALHRSQIGSVALDPGLQPGEYRELTAQERSSF